MNNKKRGLSVLLGLFGSVHLGLAQTPVRLSYTQYMTSVINDNLGYAAEKLNVPAAQAEVTAAKVFNDPNLSVSYYNNENNTLQMG